MKNKMKKTSKMKKETISPEIEAYRLEIEEEDPHIEWFFFIVGSIAIGFIAHWILGLLFTVLMGFALCHIVYSWTPKAKKERKERILRFRKGLMCVDDIAVLCKNPSSLNKRAFAKKWPDWKELVDALQSPLIYKIMWESGFKIEDVECAFRDS